MSINIEVRGEMISMKGKYITLADFQIEQKKNEKLNKKISTDKLGVPAKKSSEIKIAEKRKGKHCSKRRKDIGKKKERSKHNLMKLEKRYQYLENICYEYISPKDDEYKSVLGRKDSRSTDSVSTLLELTQQVLRLEQEVNAVLSLGRIGNGHNCNSTRDDYCEIADFLLKLNKVKKRLVDEFDLNLSSHLETRSGIDDSTVNSELRKSWSYFSDDVIVGNTEKSTTVSASSGLDEQMIDMLTEEISKSLEKFGSSLRSTPASNCLDEGKQNEPLSPSAVLADLPKISPSFSRNSLLYRGKPPANLICSNYKKLDIDFTIHELSVIYETDAEFSRSSTRVSNLQ